MPSHNLATGRPKSEGADGVLAERRTQRGRRRSHEIFLQKTLQFLGVAIEVRSSSSIFISGFGVGVVMSHVLSYELLSHN
jgi:hypothetical protein